MVARTRNCLVVGASSGVGLALAKSLHGDDRNHVFATWRSEDHASALGDMADDRLVALHCDTTDDASLADLARQLGEQTDHLGLVIHAAGVLHDGEMQPEKALAQAERASLLRSLEVNALGPLLLAQAIEELVQRDRPSHYAALTAMVGSIDDNRLGGWYGYRASKAAANQFLRTLAIEWKRTRPEATVLAIHPGTTDTPLSQPFQSRVPEDKLYTPEQSARRILEVIDGHGPEHTGTFRNWDGNEIPW